MFKTEANFLWDDKKGPLENLFHLGEMGGMVVGPGPVKLLLFFGSMFGLGAAELGRYLDEHLELNSLKDIEKYSPREAATKVTKDLFEIDDSELAKASFMYVVNFEKMAKVEQNIINAIPLSIQKEAIVGRMLKHLFKKRIKGKGRPGFIGSFFSSILGLFSWAWSLLKMAIVGGVGVLALKGTDLIHPDKPRETKTKVRETPTGIVEDVSRGLVDISTKETVNPYKIKLEKRIEEILER